MAGRARRADTLLTLDVVEHRTRPTPNDRPRSRAARGTRRRPPGRFSSSERPRMGPHAWNSCRLRSARSAKSTMGATYRTPCSANTSRSLVNAAFAVSGVTVTVGQALVPCTCFSGRVQHVDHREEDAVELPPGVLHEQQVVDVRDGDLRRKARIDGAAPRALAVHVVARVVRVDDVAEVDAQALEVRVEERRVREHVQDAGDADTEPAATRGERCAVAAGPGPDARRRHVGHLLDIPAAETPLCDAISTKFGFAFLIASRPDLMARISLTSSTEPFSQVAMMSRCSSSALATFDTSVRGAAKA